MTEETKKPTSIKTGRTVICAYCGKEADLVTGYTIYRARHDLHHKHFWYCKPCEAYVGCHGESDKPLGRLAKADLRAAKILAHASFDRLWRGDRKIFSSRSAAYAWLGMKLGKSKEECHIGEFDVATCNNVVSMCDEKWAEYA
jgi:hypothetical protein